MRLYTELGIGNPSFVSTEIEYPDGTEERVVGFRKMQVENLYFRIWIGYNVYIFPSRSGFNKKIKNRKDFKILVGVEGIEK